MLYAHGPDLCHMAELKHAMANCFESLLGKNLQSVIQESRLTKTHIDNVHYMMNSIK